jgi:ABC-2 type transport system permease protein
MPSSRQHFYTISWLRWRIFVNTLRGKGAKGEFVAKLLSYPILALMVLGPSFGAGFGAWYFIYHGRVQMLAIPLWLIFVLWQFIGMNTSATGPTFDLSSLIRFPLRYRDYFLIRLTFGLMDPPTLAGIGCLFATTIGIGIADLSLLPWSVLLLAIYAACNVFFSRMVYSWMERWLAQRRTRELVTGILIAISLGVQFLAQYAQRLGHSDPNSTLSPFLHKTAGILVEINWFLPPGLVATSIDHLHRGFGWIAIAALLGLVAYTATFLLILHLRLHAEFHGENLSEAPAPSKSVKKSASRNAPASSFAPAGGQSNNALSFLPAAIAACLIKEVRYLLRSGPKLYVLIMPIFVVFLFSVRSSGLEYMGVGGHNVHGILFAYGCAYMQLIFVSLIYNSLGTDSAGVQFYFIAPLRMRDVMLAKNLMVFALFAVEVVLIYIIAAFITTPATLSLAVATVAWSLFTLFLNISIGNMRSIISPKGVDPSKVRGQNVSGLNSLLSLLVVAVSISLGALMMFICGVLGASYWSAAGVFFILAAVSFVSYLLALNKIDDLAAANAEHLTRELSKV